ncbi:hypothetical protein PybrP1_000235 [[Pythium] brassicae (nom. inval.)]|nr:hypothetical protein PybrP1_000235 [[Pythium] brassicae (nom. inval.)]
MVSSSPAPIKSSLDANAPPFYPSMSWYPAVTTDAYDEESPSSSGFELADAYFQVQEIPDEDLFDAECHPLSAAERLELDQVDEINAMLADLELLETHQELYLAAHQSPAPDARADGDVANLMKKLSMSGSANGKRNDFVKHSAPRLPKNSFHAKKNAFAPIYQPRSVK